MESVVSEHYDVLIIGGGSAGIAAAMAAAKNGAKTLLVESGPMVGGDLVSGLPVDGCMSASGDWIVGGIIQELFQSCKEAGGYVDEVFDWRLMYAVCFDPEILKLVIIDALSRYKVKVLLYSLAQDIVVKDNQVTGVVVINKSGRKMFTADMIIDCTGDGSIAVSAGAEYELGNSEGVFQPISLVYRIGNVDYMKYLEFVRDNPEQFVLGESPVIDVSPAECAQRLYDKGYPFAALNGKSSLLGKAIETGEMYPTTAIFVYPTSLQRNEVGINASRIANVNAMDIDKLSSALPELVTQVNQCLEFVKNRLPGFENSCLSGVSPHVGIRETRRIVGEYTLKEEDVIDGRHFDDSVARGCHHVDVHGSGTDQVRIPVKEGKSYGIPYGCLIPKRLENLFIAGRCLSSTREANGSARVMGQCMATGQAVGVAAAMCVSESIKNVRDLSINKLQDRLREQGAIF